MFNFFKNKIIFVSDYDANIGNLSEKLFYIIHKAKRENKKILFVRKKLFFKPVFNKIKYKQLSGMYNLESEYIDKNSFIENILGFYYGMKFSLYMLILSALYVLRIKRPFSYELMGKGFQNIINISNESTFKKDKADEVDWSKLYEEKLEFNFSKDLEDKYLSNLEKMGVKKNDWYVCLHIRTSFFHDDPNSSYRNSSPENYKKTIEFINKKGGKVIRLGDPVDMSINNICIDYPNSEYKSENMDLYLINNCKFYMGTNSGILDTAFLFGTPMLGVNFSDFCLTKAFKSCDKILYKHVYKKSEKTELSFADIFSQKMYINPNLNENYLNSFMDEFYIEENSEDEILNATIEMYNELENPKIKDELDLKFDKIVETGILRWIEEESDYFKVNIEQAYRFYLRTSSNGKVCRFQLESNIF